jgi:acetylornithine deacetylase/succinyl-diaminopimelate desuccinylase-like protein
VFATSKPTAHGRDERILIKSFYEAQEFLYELVREFASGK